MFPRSPSGDEQQIGGPKESSFKVFGETNKVDVKEQAAAGSNQLKLLNGKSCYRAIIKSELEY